jgi:hypothetical protein
VKKIVSLAVFVAVSTTVADAAPSYIKRDDANGYRVTYDYMDKANNGWYIGGRVGLNLMSWKNDYSTDAPNANELHDDDYFEALFGGGVFVGKSLNYLWRAEIEGGMLGQFEDEFGGTTFKMAIPYLMANGYRDFANGMYVGAGAGIALPKTKLLGHHFTGGDSSQRAVSPIVGLMVGYSHRLDYNLTLDLRYRLSGLYGTEHARKFIYKEDGETYDIKNEIGLMLENAVSLGIRYNF